jgi:prepilin-type N-terminal cleavage/methylation domain-containing protein
MKKAFLKDNQHGFTLIELLIGLLAAAAITYATLSLYVTQHKQLIIQDEISDLQGNIRASTEMLALTIRKAGFNIRGSLMAIETDDTNPDSITITFDSGAVRGVVLESDMSLVTEDLNCSGHDLTELEAGDWAYIFDPDSSTGEFFLVSDVNQMSGLIGHSTMALTQKYPAGSDILKISRIKFFVSPNDDSTRTDLMIQVYGSQPEIFAENIIDLNFRYFLESGAIVTQTNTPGQIRMVEIDVLGRTGSPDPEFFEQYRTRNFTLRVKVRNLGIG